MESEEVRQRREIGEACRGMDALAEKLGDWDPVRLIRGFRESRTIRIGPIDL